MLPPEQLTIAVNVGDDFEHLGLAICPDLDSVCYALAGVDNEVTGWGRAGETWEVMRELSALGGDSWFRLGDRDLALHLLRTQALRSGASLSEATAAVARRFSIEHTVRPISDQPVRTQIDTTEEGWLAFQHYFVAHQCRPAVRGFRYVGAQTATLAPEVAKALDDDSLAGVILCPSNPYLSIGPMLAIPALHERLVHRDFPVLAVSPIVAGRALKGPAAKIMADLGVPVSSREVARHYGPLIDGLLVDSADEAEFAGTPSGDAEVIVTDSVMRSRADRERLARACVDWIRGRLSK
jgi:LPPG:FO 2-phospho-L-lactate transferase